MSWTRNCRTRAEPIITPRRWLTWNRARRLLLGAFIGLFAGELALLIFPNIPHWITLGLLALGFLEFSSRHPRP